MVIHYNSNSTESVDIIAIGNGDGEIWEETDDTKTPREDDGRARDRAGMEPHSLRQLLEEGEWWPKGGKPKEETAVKGINWLSDPRMLPSIQVRAIMEFRYSKKGASLRSLAKSLLQSVLKEYKDGQPIIFVAYGHGGLVLELTVMIWYDHYNRQPTALALSGPLIKPSSTASTAASPPKITVTTARQISADTVGASDTQPATQLDQDQPQTSLEAKPQVAAVDSSQGSKLPGEQPRPSSESKPKVATVDSSQGSKSTEDPPRPSSESKPKVAAVNSPPKKTKPFQPFLSDRAARRPSTPGHNDGGSEQSVPANNSGPEIGKTEPGLGVIPDMSHVAGIVLLGSTREAPKISLDGSDTSTAQAKPELKSLLDANLKSDKLDDMTQNLADTVYHTCFESIVNEIGLATECYLGTDQFDPEAGKPFPDPEAGDPSSVCPLCPKLYLRIE